MDMKMCETLILTDLMPQDEDDLKLAVPEPLRELLDANREVVF